MPSLPRYNQINNAIQQDGVNGCIPWAIEWLIRYKGNVSGILGIPVDDLDFYQFRFNLHEQTDGEIQNTFINVLEMIREFYPDIGLVHCNTYGNGQAAQKFQRTDQFIGKGIPCITSIRLLPQHNTHIVPVIEVGSDNVSVIWGKTASDNQDIRIIPTTIDFFNQSSP